MQDAQLTISNVYSKGWQKTKEKYWLLLGSFAVLILIGFVFNIVTTINNSFANGNTSVTTALIVSTIALIIGIGNYAVQALTSYGFTRIQLNILDEKAASVGQLFKAEGVYWRYFGAFILFGLLVVAGIILLIVPGIYWAIKYQFTLPLIVDKKRGIKEAFKESGQITMGHKGWLLGLAIVLFLTNIAGILALGIGLLITAPLTVMIQIYVYRLLAGSAKAAAVQTPIEKVAATS